MDVNVKGVITGFGRRAPNDHKHKHKYNHDRECTGNQSKIGTSGQAKRNIYTLSGRGQS